MRERAQNAPRPGGQNAPGPGGVRGSTLDKAQRYSPGIQAHMGGGYKAVPFNFS